ncbi:facilitated trehalose transporter Tret1-like [Fopius arisanus]|uniref:Facilitated trehalose transporter Tret1-like n=1 Tax=Fopius arisanus TaxID=64838 RepID=A0A9R1T2C6_9HYME|nr:PREDICTED: facilitated trehalose transporter Tret1-like [Fopius arisanus]
MTQSNCCGDSEDDGRLEARNFLPKNLKRGKSFSDLTWKDAVPQIIASCMAYCVVIQAGVNMAYSTVLNGGLESENAEIKITKADASWIASLVTISLPLGSLMSGPLMDRFGRKIACILTCVPAIISWLLLIFSHSLTLIYTARIIAGISAGMSTVAFVYVIEITHPKIRAMMLCLNSVFVSLGILITCVLALFLDWRKIAMVFIALNTSFLFLLFIIPESPYWLICFDNQSNHSSIDRNKDLDKGDNQVDEELQPQDTKSPVRSPHQGPNPSSKQYPNPLDCSARHRRAQKYLRWLNPNNEIYHQELQRIEESNRSKCSTSGASREGILRNYLEAVKSPGVYKPICLLFVILLAQQLSGTYVVIFYAISVFREIGGTFGDGLNEYGALVLLGFIRFIMSIITSLLSRKIGRRVLCVASGLGMAFSMFFSGMIIFLTSFCTGESEGAQQKWMLLVIVLFYVCMSSLGFVVIPWSLVGELLPISFRGVGGGIMVSVAYLIMFVVIKSYPSALDAMGAQNVFFGFSVVSLIGTAVVYLFLPETLGKSLQEIEEYFTGKGERA